MERSYQALDQRVSMHDVYLLNTSANLDSGKGSISSVLGHEKKMRSKLISCESRRENLDSIPEQRWMNGDGECIEGSDAPAEALCPSSNIKVVAPYEKDDADPA